MALGQLDLAIELLEGDRRADGRGPATKGGARHAQGAQAPARAATAARAGARRAAVRARGRGAARRRPAPGGRARRGGDARHARRAAGAPPAQARAPAPGVLGAARAARRRARARRSAARSATRHARGGARASCSGLRERAWQCGACRNARGIALVEPRPAAHLPRRARAPAARRARQGQRRARRDARVAQTRQGPALRRRDPRSRRPLAAPRRTSSRSCCGEEHDLGSARRADGSANRSARTTTCSCSPSALQAGAPAGRLLGPDRATHAQGHPERDRARREARAAQTRRLREGERALSHPPKRSARDAWDGSGESRAAPAQPTLTTVSVRLPRGSDTDDLSPAARPSSATATGDSADSRPSRGGGVVGADDPPGVLARRPGRARRTVEPKPTTPPRGRRLLDDDRAAIFSRSRAIFVSRCACSFLASWYSLFSFRSPHSRAVLMRSAISRRPSPSSAASSASSVASPSAVVRFGCVGHSPGAYSLARRRLARPQKYVSAGSTAARRSARSRPGTSSWAVAGEPETNTSSLRRRCSQA